MIKIFAIFLLSLPLVSSAQDQKEGQIPPTLRGILLDQLKTTHNEKDWLVPANIAVEGLTAEQANWNDGHGNHSIGQLAYTSSSGTRKSWRHSRVKSPSTAARTMTPSTTSTRISGKTL